MHIIDLGSLVGLDSAQCNFDGVFGPLAHVEHVSS